MFSSEVRMGNLIDTFKDFKATFSVTSKTMTEFMERIFYENEQTKKIVSMEWDTHFEMVVFGASTSQLNVSQIESRAQYYLRKELPHTVYAARYLNRHLFSHNVQYKKFMPVKVRIIEIYWLNGKMGQFYKFMSAIDDEKVFDSDLIKVILGP
jgi:hypothetical protein